MKKAITKCHIRIVKTCSQSNGTQNMKMETKQTILIAGATGNIGKAAAIALAKRGARVIILGRSISKLHATRDSIYIKLSKEQLQVNENTIETLEIDFSCMHSVKKAANEALDRFPVINCLVLSVGALIQNGPNILSNGHEAMFATNVMGPFLFTQLLVSRLTESNGMVLHVIAPFYKRVDWNDLECIKKHKTMIAFDRTKTLNRVFAAELARQYEGKISSVAFDPAYVIDKSDPELKKRWPSGFWGLAWRIMTILLAKPTAVAGEPIAYLILSGRDRRALNGALFKLYKRVNKKDKAMKDEVFGKRLWEELELITQMET